jgi:hypothetical protein
MGRVIGKRRLWRLPVMRARPVSFVCLIAWLTFGVGCSRSGGFSTVPPKDTPQTNQARAQIGIRQIKTNWSFYGREFQAEKWKDSTNLCKVVQRNKTGALLWEEDYYYSGISFDTPKGIQWECFSVHYDYTTKRASLDYVGTNAAISTIIRDLKLTPFGSKDQVGQRTQSSVGSDDKETFAVADKVLAIWNRSRL